MSTTGLNPAQLKSAQHENLFGNFSAISLEHLNKKASMLNRLDNKYIVSREVMRQILPALAEQFEILEIDGKRDFTYETCYFDDDSYSAYFAHHQGRRKRVKVRTRNYLDSDLCFLEMKIKSTRGMTIKKRLAIRAENARHLNTSAREQLNLWYQSVYNEEFSGTLQPVLDMHYQRMTLVALHGSERMTIDHHLGFTDGTTSKSISEDLFILEDKSVQGNGIADQILRRYHQHPTNQCSKYCVGMSIMEKITKHNRFLPAIRKLTVPHPSERQSNDKQVEYSSDANDKQYVAIPFYLSDKRRVVP
jgi:hypothetical protein